MSFIHSTIVGHFDPTTLNARHCQVNHPLNIVAAKSLLAEFPDHVAAQIEFREGYVECWWAGGSSGFSQPVHDYAYRLAEIQNCIAAESPAYIITYPEDAQQEQIKAWKRWREQNPPRERESPALSIFNPPKPGPCPYCGKPLRTAIARQCRFCKMDWHDPQNVHLRDSTRK